MSNEDFAPITLDKSFPIDEPVFVRRTEMSPHPPHVHDCFETGYCYDGAGIFMIENKILRFNAGDAVIINHRELHILRALDGGGTSCGFVNLDPAGLLAGHVMIGDNSLGTDNLSGPSFQNVIKSAERPDICFLARDIIAELKEKKNGYKAAVRALVWALMVKLRRIKPPEPENEWRTDRKKLALITPALRHISENYSGTLEMDKLARLCGCGVSNFRKLFHSAAGCSPAAYIKKLKMSVASALVKNTAKPMLEIAAAAGFPTVSNFNRQFRDYFGVPPREMRRRSG